MRFFLILIGIAIILGIITPFYTSLEALALYIPSVIILLIVSMPVLFRTKIDVFSVWAYLVYFVFLNVVLRSFCIVNFIPNFFTIDTIFLLGKDVSFLFYPSIVTLIGFAAITFGYLNNPIRVKKQLSSFSLSNEWNQKRFNWLMVFLLGCALIAFYKFISVSIISIFALSSENMSSYRGISEDLSEYNSHGYLRWVIQFSDIVFYLVFVNLVLGKKKQVLHIVLLVLSLIISIAFYIFVQSRSGIIVLFINSFAINYYLSGKKISVKKLAIIGVVSLSFFGFVTSLRGGSGYEVSKIDIYYPLHALEPFIVNNGGIDISKTGHIINYVDEHKDYKYGSTLTWLFIAWVPRNFWPDKPVNIDTDVGIKIYGATTYGTGAVPPGIFAELYWNFWYVGVIGGCLVVGMILNYVHKFFILKAGGRNHVIIYVLCFMQIGLAITGSSLNSAFAGTLFVFIPLYLVLKFITVKPIKIVNEER